MFPLSARVAALVEAEAAATSSGPRPFDSLAPAEVASWLAAHGAVQHWATVATHSSLSGARMRELSARRGALGDAGPADGVELPPRTEMFAFPTGARLAAGDGPAPAPPIETHTFVITDFAGRRLYFHCAVRHHRVSTRKLSLVRLQIGAKLMSSGLLDARDASSGDGARRRGLGGPSAAPRESAPETDLPQTIYEPQILCVLSLLPYHASLRRALVAFARTVPEDEELTLEHAASLHAMLAKRAPASPAPPTAIELPPSARGAADAEPDARDGARPAASPRLTVPSLATRAWEREHGPQTDEPRARAPEGSSADARRQFHYRGIEQSLRPLLRRLEPKHVVLLYTAVLCERSVLVLSASASDLVASLEAIRALLHPLEWPHIYIPLTPPHRELLEIFEAPVPYLAGLLRGPAGCGAMAAPPPPDNAPTSPPGPRTPAKSHAVAPQPDSEERGARRARARTGSIEARSRLNLVDVDAALALKLAPDAIVVDLDANQVLDARRLAKAGGPADDDGDESLLLDLSLLPPRLALRLHHAIEVRSRARRPKPRATDQGSARARARRNPPLQMHAPIFRVHHPNDVLQGAQLPSTADGPTREFARELSKGTGSHEWAGEEDGEDPTPAAHERSADRGGPLPGRADANANDARDMQMWSPCSWKLLDWTSERMARENVVSPSTTPGASEPASGGSTRRSRGGAPPTSIATPTGGSATPSGRTDVFWKQLPSRRQSWKPSVTLKLLHILHSSEEDEDESCQLSPTADAARDGRSLKFSARDGDSDNDIADIAETGAGGRAATAARGAASPCQEDGVRSLSPTALGVARSPLSEPPAGASDDAGRAAAERFAEAAAPLEPSEGADGRQGLLDARPGGGDVEDDADGPLARQENRCTNEPALRAAFLGVLVSLLQGYRQHLVLDVPDAPPAASGPAAGADQRIFDAGAFVAQVARRRSECAPFVRGLCETQMFHMFLHARVLSGASAAPAERAPDAPATGGAPSVALDLFDRRIRQRLKQKALRIALHSSATDIDLELGEMWKAKRGTQSRHWRRRRFALLHTPTLDDDDRPAGGPPRSPERDAADDSSAALGMSLCLGCVRAPRARPP